MQAAQKQSNNNSPELVEISSAFLQSAITVPGWFAGQSTLSKEKAVGVSMFETTNGLLMIKGDKRAMTPWANVKSVVYK